MASSAITRVTIDPEIAKRAITKYNEGKYGSRTNPQIDKEAADTFARGLGSTYHEILDQVEFIGWDYDGFDKNYRKQPDARIVARGIARYVFDHRTEYEQAASQALDILQQTPSLDTIETLYKPFVQPLILKRRTVRNWQVWAVKFWHFLNHDAFPIRDSRADTVFGVKGNSVPEKYLSFLDKFKQFVLPKQDWLPHLREVDGTTCVPITGRAWCDNKLWDKVFYGLAELDSK